MARNIDPGGAGQPTSVGVHFISNPKVLEMVLTNGYDRRIDLQVLPPHNKTFKTYEELYEQFLEYYDIVIDCLVTTNNIQHDVWRKHNMSLVNSFLKPDCLAKGQHIGNMGYRYNATYNIEDTGTINMVNSLYNIKNWCLKIRNILWKNLQMRLLITLASKMLMKSAASRLKLRKT